MEVSRCAPNDIVFFVWPPRGLTAVKVAVKKSSVPCPANPLRWFCLVLFTIQQELKAKIRPTLQTLTATMGYIPQLNVRVFSCVKSVNIVDVTGCRIGNKTPGASCFIRI